MQTEEKNLNKDRSDRAEQLQELTPETVELIDSFATKQRLEVMRQLFLCGALPQKDLADKIGSSPTSLWGILKSFERLEIKLLIQRNEGRFKFYSLSEIGRQYIEKKSSGVRQTCDEETVKHLRPLREAAAAAVEKLKRLKTARGKNIAFEVDNYCINYLLANTSFQVDSEVIPYIEAFLKAVRALIVAEDPEYDIFLDSFSEDGAVSTRLCTCFDKTLALKQLFSLMENEQYAADLNLALLDMCRGRAIENWEALGLEKKQMQDIEETVVWLCRKEGSADSSKAIMKDIREICDFHNSAAIAALTNAIYLHLSENKNSESGE